MRTLPIIIAAIALIMIAGTATAAAPVASFTSDVTLGNAPLLVSFEDTSTGDPTLWEWSFGDGTANSTNQHPPAHTYTTPGIYTVILNATNGDGTSYATGTITVRSAAPIASFTADYTLGVAPLVVSFADTSGNTPTAWNWRFGDGKANSTNKNPPAHTYTRSGVYTVLMGASNAYGTTYATMTITVSSQNFTAWPYYMDHTINRAAASALSDYCIRLVFHNTSGTSTGANICMGDTYSPGFTDVVAVNASTGVEYPIWLETTSANATSMAAWIRITDTIPASGTISVRVYYGNSGAESRSNGNAVFPFFDDFDGSVLDPLLWEKTMPSGVSVANSAAGANRISADSQFRTLQTWGTGYAAEFYGEMNSIPFAWVGFTDTDTYYDAGSIYLGVWGGHPNIGSGKWGMVNQVGASVGTYQANTAYMNRHWFSILRPSNGVPKYMFNGAFNNPAFGFATSTSLHFTVSAEWHAGNYALLQWVAIRPYADVEPTHGAWTNESVQVTPIPSATAAPSGLTDDERYQYKVTAIQTGALFLPLIFAFAILMLIMGVFLRLRH